MRKVFLPSIIYYLSNKTCETISKIENYFINAWNTVKEEIYVAKDATWLIDRDNIKVCLYLFT